MTIPTTTFHGWIKQVPSDGLTPEGKKFLEQYFPSFYEEDEMMALLRSNGINGVVWSTGSRITSTGRLRRYSGGKSLPRSRYFSLCSDESGNDNGTLIKELMAYSRQVKGIKMLVIDSTVHSEEARFIWESANGTMPYSDFLAALLFPVGGTDEPTRGADVVTLKLEILGAEIENTLDLRIRHVQDWFHETFVNAENFAGFRGVHGIRTAKGHPKNFRELLPSLLTQERGGNNFHDSVGHWLRSKGINALIFPSARMNVSVKCSGENIEAFEGWNIVIYAGEKMVEQQGDTIAFGLSGGWALEEDVGIRVVHWEDDGTKRYWRVEKMVS